MAGEALLDYAFCSLLSTQLRKHPERVDEAYHQIESMALQGMEICWYSNKNDEKVYRNFRTADPFDLQSVKLHNFMEKSLSFKYQSRGELFSTNVSIRLVTDFCNSAPADSLTMDDFGVYVKYNDTKGKTCRKFLFKEDLQAKNLRTVRDVKKYYQHKGMVVSDLRFIDYLEYKGKSMDNSLVRLWYKKYQNNKKAKGENRDLPMRSQNGGGNGLLICIAISVVIMFFMAYMASIYDINEENYWANYDVLRLPYEATHDEVKKQFRLLSREYHPDKNPGCSDCEARMAEIERAKTAILKYDKAREQEIHGSQK